MDLRLATAIMLEDSTKTVKILRLAHSLPVRVLDKTQVTHVGTSMLEPQILDALKILLLLLRLISIVNVIQQPNL